MIKKSKFIYIIGSAIIGIIALLIVFFTLIASGVINIRQNKLIFASATNTKFIYDGSPHSDGQWQLKEGELKKGHEAVVTVSGAQTDAGSSPNYISAKIIDELGADVTSDYDIEYQTGVLTVHPREISVLSAYAEKEYDGQPLTLEECEVTEGTLASSHRISPRFSGSITGAGNAINYYTVSVINSRGADKTANYKINYNYGILTVTPREITITSSSAEKEYDGTPLISEKSSLTSGSLVEGHECLVEVSGSRTEAGTAKNKFGVTITDADGNEVTSNYSITREEGDLTVKRRPVIVLSASAEKEYDGEPLTAEGYEVIGGLLEGHECKAVTDGSTVNAGTVKNTFTAQVSDGDGNDVSANYEIRKSEGDLKVSPRTVTIQTGTAHKIYDGEPLTADVWRYAADKQVFEGHTLIVKPAGSITDIGKQGNFVPEENVSVIDEAGESVLSNYKISVIEGWLTVTPRPVAVRSGEASKFYDGTPLTCDEWEVVSITQPVTGHNLAVKVTGTITEIGQTDNFISSVIVMDGDKEVTYNYEISHYLGLLTVNGNDSGSGGDKEDYENNGDLDDQGKFSGGGSGEKRPAVKITSDISGKVYLRFMSFGDYAFQGFQKAAEYGKTFTFNGNSYGYNYLTSVALSKSPQFSANRAAIEVLGTDYYLPYYTDLGASGYEIQTSDVSYSGDYREPYALFYYFYDYITDGAIYNSLGGFADEEKEYADFVRKNYTAVPESTRNVLKNLIAQFNINDPELIGKVAQFVQGSAEYDPDYDRTLDGETDVVVSFLTEYKKGVCRHYAGAATVLYRMLGIPARYVIGYTGDTVAGEEVVIETDKAHAWVEVYIDGMGWVQVEVTAGFGGGGDGEGGGGGKPDQPVKYKVKPENCYALYDGFTHTHDGKLQGLSELTERGYEYMATVSGEGTSPGKYSCTITDFKLFFNGEEVTEQFLPDISFDKGTLQIYLYELDLSTGGASREYDGTALENPEIAVSGKLVSAVTGELMNGDTITRLFAYGSQTDAGDMTNRALISISDADGNDTTYNYKINYDYGNLHISAREITVTAASDEKQFDGTPLTNGSWDITAGSLAEGHTAQVIVSGTLGGVGTAENKIISVVILDENGSDVTKNYKVTTVSGTLKVTLP